MSKSMNALHDKNSLRWQLLTSVSALALIASAYGAGTVQAADSDTDHAPLWIELGAQMESITGQGDRFAPAFLAANADSPAFKPVSPLGAQRATIYNFAGDGTISFQPNQSDWIFSASIRYGRSNRNRHIAQQTYGHRHKDVRYYYPIGKKTSYVTLAGVNFSQTDASHDQGHLIVDFQVGKDVGLGLFGRNDSSQIGFGVRFAQFNSKSAVQMHAVPDLKTFNFFSAHPSLFPPSYYFAAQKFHAYTAFGHSARSFHGVGPSISWNSSVPVAGNPRQSEIDIDWGINASVLFGRQRVSGSHQTISNYKRFGVPYVPPQSHSTPFARARAAVVPNVGGFAGLSFRYADAKISFGYRGDFFFGAMDTGIDVRKSTTLGFFGPYASISVGVGD